MSSTPLPFPKPPPSLPPRFLARLAQIVPAERLAGVLASFATEKAPTFRVNTLRRANALPAKTEHVRDTTSADNAPASAADLAPLTPAGDATVLAELAGVAATAAEGLPHVYRARPADRDALVRSPAADDGRIYISNIASLLAAPALDVTPGLAVLDLAAAPGGKTLHLAALLDNRGSLAAVESSRPRFFRLQRNLKLHGVTCCRTFLRDGRTVGRACPDQFDRVLLDAPCSGEARLGDDAGAGPGGSEHSRPGASERNRASSSPRKLPDSTRRRRPNWSERKIARCAGKQRTLLASAVEACRPGGLIVYCTCTLAPEENEAVIADTLERFAGELTSESVPLPACAANAAVPALDAWKGRRFPPGLSAAVRILPDDWFDAFFLCRLRKSRGASASRRH